MGRAAPRDAAADPPHASVAETPRRRTYGAVVHAIDRNVGRAMGALEEQALTGDTLLVSCNDNGGDGSAAKPHTRNTARNIPYRGHKFDVPEGGVRAAMVDR